MGVISKLRAKFYTVFDMGKIDSTKVPLLILIVMNPCCCKGL